MPHTEKRRRGDGEDGGNQFGQTVNKFSEILAGNFPFPRGEQKRQEREPGAAATDADGGGWQKAKTAKGNRAAGEDNLGGYGEEDRKGKMAGWGIYKEDEEEEEEANG